MNYSDFSSIWRFQDRNRLSVFKRAQVVTYFALKHLVTLDW